MCVRPTVRNLRENTAFEVHKGMFCKPEKLLLAATAIIVSDTGKMKDKCREKRTQSWNKDKKLITMKH